MFSSNLYDVFDTSQMEVEARLSQLGIVVLRGVAWYSTFFLLTINDCIQNKSNSKSQILHF